MSEEIWKPVPSFEGLMASSLGRLLLPVRHYPMPNGAMRTTKPKPFLGTIRRSDKSASHRYRGFWTKYYGNVKAHRAVCEAFHGPKPDKDSVVLHINENALDNRPENLAWGTRKENQNAPGFKAWASSVARAKFTGNSGMRKPIYAATTPRQKA